MKSSNNKTWNEAVYGKNMPNRRGNWNFKYDESVRVSVRPYKKSKNSKRRSSWRVEVIFGRKIIRRLGWLKADRVIVRTNDDFSELEIVRAKEIELANGVDSKKLTTSSKNDKEPILKISLTDYDYTPFPKEGFVLDSENINIDSGRLFLRIPDIIQNKKIED